MIAGRSAVLPAAETKIEPKLQGTPAQKAARMHWFGEARFGMFILETPATGDLTLRLSDELLDLDKPLRVVAGGRTVFEGKVSRSLAAIEKSLQERQDSDSIATALLPVSW